MKHFENENKIAYNINQNISITVHMNELNKPIKERLTH